jgi:hypothetical protein
MIVPTPIIAFPIAALVAVGLTAGAWFGGVGHGKFVERAAHTEQQLAQANRSLADSQKNQETADKAGAEHEQHVQIVRERTREIVRTVTIPPDADPFVPVWFVRLYDRLASRAVNADPYPGQSEGDPSDVRLSETRPLLARASDEYFACRKQIEDIVALKPVLPPPAAPERGFLERLTPF